jgi:hypothetical protein
MAGLRAMALFVPSTAHLLGTTNPLAETLPFYDLGVNRPWLLAEDDPLMHE